jgi:hypothetical protein
VNDLFSQVMSFAPTLGGLMGVYMGIKISIARIEIKLQNLHDQGSREIKRLEVELQRMRESVDRRAYKTGDSQ